MADSTPVDTAADKGAVKATGASPKLFKARIAQTKKKRRELLAEWKINIDMRRGKAADVDGDELRNSSTVDWSQTKTKTSQLFSQVPKVVVTAQNKAYKPAASTFGQRLNMRLKKAKVGAAMDEVMPDVTNASGIGAAYVSYEALSDVRRVPVGDPETYSMLDKALYTMGVKEEPMQDQTFITDRKFSCTRISPGDLLWDTDFVRSDFDESAWIGRDGRATWTVAQKMLNLKDEDKDKVLGDSRQIQDRLVDDAEAGTEHDQDVVSYSEIFYWRYLYHADEKYYTAIQRMVFVDGLDEPVVNEQWNGQKFDEELKVYVGACRFPIQVLTLNYMTDEAIPPSDSAMARGAVLELIRTRIQVAKQRSHSNPMNWYDVNRIDADIQTLLMQGDWDGAIPVQGDGSRALGQVARAAYPNEDYAFERMYKQDVGESWGAGPNQGGQMASGERSAAEAKITQGNFSTRINQERARTVAFFIGIADVMAGLIALHDDFELPDIDDEQRQKLTMWDRTRISHELAFTIRGDSTIILDANQRIERIMRFLNIAGKSGYAKLKPLMDELAALCDLDPETVVQEPQQKGPEPPNVSFRFSGIEDLRDPMAVAMLLQSGQGPTPESLTAAKKLILEAASLVPTPPPAPAPAPGGEGGASPAAEDRHPDWQAMDRVNSRRDATQE